MNALREHIPEYAMEEIAAGIHLAADAVNVPIADDLDFDQAAAVLRNLRKARKRLEEQKHGITAKWADPKRLVDEHYRPVLDALDNADRVFADALGRYYGKQYQKAQRIEGREISKADDRRGRLLLAADKDLEKADAHALAGDNDRSLASIQRAQSAIDNAVELVAPIEEVHKPENLGFGKRTVAKVVNLDAAVAFCLSHHEFRKAINVDPKVLEDLRRRSHDTQDVAGVEFTQEFRPIARGDR